MIYAKKENLEHKVLSKVHRALLGCCTRWNGPCIRGAGPCTEVPTPRRQDFKIFCILDEIVLYALRMDQVIKMLDLLVMHYIQCGSYYRYVSPNISVL